MSSDSGIVCKRYQGHNRYNLVNSDDGRNSSWKILWFGKIKKGERGIQLIMKSANISCTQPHLFENLCGFFGSHFKDNLETKNQNS